MQVTRDAFAILDDEGSTEPFLHSQRVDRRACGHGEELDEHLVVLREPALLLGEVEVPEHPVADGHGDPEEAPHRRMVVREADGIGV